MTLHDVTVEERVRGEAPFKVDSVAGLQPAEGCAREGFAHEVRLEAARSGDSAKCEGEAGTVDGEGAALREVARELAGIQHEPGRAVLSPLERFDNAGALHDPRKHAAILPRSQPRPEVGTAPPIIWQLDDPAGQDLETVRRIRDEIRAHVEQLAEEFVPAVKPQ